MFVKALKVEGYKHFGKPFEVELNKGLNVFVGENGSGKTTIIDALRLLLLEDEYGRGGATDTDFHLAFTKGARRSARISVSALFQGLTKDELVAFLPWGLNDGDAQLSLEIDNHENNRGGFKRTMWGGSSRSNMFERELVDRINCIYLPPMRDAEAKLRQGKGSRLARLLKNLNQHLLDDGQPPLVDEVQKFNTSLSSAEGKAIYQANELIRTALIKAVGTIFGQDTLIQFTESSFGKIVEGLRLVFFPFSQTVLDPEVFRSLEENSLGYNNLLYVATVMAELAHPNSNSDYLRILLIEEPEAHLHPQLQVRLLKYLEEQAQSAGIQVIVTTHSPVLASSVKVETMVHLSSNSSGRTEAVQLSKCELWPNSSAFISRWLDATKSYLLFAKAVILVEGISEALLLPELAAITLRIYNSTQDNKEKQIPATLVDGGVAIINLNGRYFNHFFQLFCKDNIAMKNKISIRCAGITDQDPKRTQKGADGKKTELEPPTPAKKRPGQNPALELIPKINKSINCRLFANDLLTFEYDLALEGGNLAPMISTAADLARSAGKSEIARKLEDYASQTWNRPLSNEDWDRMSEAAYYLLEHIDKGEYAQTLAEKLKDRDFADSFAVPGYISKAIIWACGGSLKND